MKDIATALFKVKTQRKAPFSGALLVAEPFLKEVCFNHGVVSIIDYVPSEGATGVVMNNRTEYMLSDLLDGVDADTKIPVFCGGPAGQDRLFFIHTLGPDVIPEAREYAPGLYVGGRFESIVEYVNAGYPTEGAVRFFMGYSSWADGQLERELSRDTWVMTPATPLPFQMLTSVGDAYWHRAVRSLGDAYRSWSLIPRNALSN